MRQIREQLVSFWRWLFPRRTKPMVPEIAPTLPPLELPAHDTPISLSAAPTLAELPAVTHRPSIADHSARLRFAPLLQPDYTVAPTPQPELLRAVPANLPVHKETDTESVQHPFDFTGVAPQEAYVQAINGTPLLTAPKLIIDNAYRQLAYGQPMTVKGYIDGYAEVVTNVGTGYVIESDITTNNAVVWPTFVNGTIYEHTNPATESLRRLIKDTFLGGELRAVLQPTEYVTWRLLRDHHAIAWPDVRPRTAGSWHQLLRGVTGIHASITPLSDTIMEWTPEDGVGRLCYVEAVLPDTTVRVSGVGIMVPGEYTELTFKPDVWKEWRPIFMNIAT